MNSYPLVRYFSNDPIQSFELLVKNSENNNELLEKLYDPRASLYHYALGLQIASMNILKDHKNIAILSESNFLKILANIEDSLMEFSLLELSHIIFFIRIIKSHKIKRMFTKEFEKRIIYRVSNEIEYADNKKMILDLYHNLGLMQRINPQIERKILEILRMQKEFLSIPEVNKIFTAGYYANMASSRILLLETIKYLENMQLENALNSDLIGLLNILQKIDERFAIGSKVINRLIEIIRERNNQLDINEIRQILEFYVNNDDYSRSLLYECLYHLENNYSGIQKRELLDIIKHISGLFRKNKRIKLSKNLLKLLDKDVKSKLEQQIIGFVEAGNLLIDYSYIHSVLPESFNRETFSNYLGNRRNPGLWEILIIRGFSAYENIEIQNIMLNIQETISVLSNSSYNVKLCAIENILNTRNFEKNNKLRDILNAILTNICKNISN